jgi:hypothetical protein
VVGLQKAEEAAVEDGEGSEPSEGEDGEGSEPVEGETSTVQEEVAKQHEAEEKLLEQEEKEGLPHGTPSWHPARRWDTHHLPLHKVESSRVKYFEVKSSQVRFITQRAGGIRAHPPPSFLKSSQVESNLLQSTEGKSNL